MSQLVTLQPGARGFDINEPLTYEMARAFSKHVVNGVPYTFVKRYVGREKQHANDLTADEIDAIHRAGLALSIVQHCEPGFWTATGVKGDDYGAFAATICRSLGIVEGCGVAVDMESVSSTSSRDDVEAFVRMWDGHVRGVDYRPEAYLGFQPGMTGPEFYKHTKIDRFWRAYNGDEIPLPRGFCIKQVSAKHGDLPPGVVLTRPDAWDVDIVQADLLGGLPTAMAPDEWGVL